MPTTETVAYTDRLESKELATWKRFLDVQAPYRWNLRRLKLGKTLDIGCGIGRNLLHLGGNGIGVDHNATSVELARKRGLTAYTLNEFLNEGFEEGSFDSLLIAHVLEHMTYSEGLAILRSYLKYLKPNGSIVFITPQEAGFSSDATHVEFIGFEELEKMAYELSLYVERKYSFPFPRFMGKLFKHNEFVYVATKK